MTRQLQRQPRKPASLEYKKQSGKFAFENERGREKSLPFSPQFLLFQKNSGIVKKVLAESEKMCYNNSVRNIFVIGLCL